MKRAQQLIRIRLQWHDAREQELVSGGMDRIAASETAYHEVVKIKSKGLLAWDRQKQQKAQEGAGNV